VLAWRIDRLGAGSFPTRHADAARARHQLRRTRATPREPHEPTDDQLALWHRVTANPRQPRSRASNTGQTMRAPLLHTVWRAVSQRDERRWHSSPRRRAEHDDLLSPEAAPGCGTPRLCSPWLLQRPVSPPR